MSRGAPPVPVEPSAAHDLYPIALAQARRAFLVTAAKGIFPIVAFLAVVLAEFLHSDVRAWVLTSLVLGVVLIGPWAVGTVGAWRHWRRLKRSTPEEAAAAGML